MNTAMMLLVALQKAGESNVLTIAALVFQASVWIAATVWFAGKWKASTEALESSFVEKTESMQRDLRDTRKATASISESVSELATVVAVLKDRSDRQQKEVAR